MILWIPTVKKWDALNTCYKFISDREKQNRPFTIQEIATATGWKEATVKTYINKRWETRLLESEKGKFKGNGIALLGLEGFKALHSNIEFLLD